MGEYWNEETFQLPIVVYSRAYADIPVRVQLVSEAQNSLSEAGFAFVPVSIVIAAFNVCISSGEVQISRDARTAHSRRYAVRYLRLVFDSLYGVISAFYLAPSEYRIAPYRVAERPEVGICCWSSAYCYGLYFAAEERTFVLYHELRLKQDVSVSAILFQCLVFRSLLYI